MGVEFLPICDVLFNVVSLASYFCDVVFDVIATYTFYVSGHFVWFGISLFSIIISLLACQIISAKWMLKQERYRNMSRRRLLILSIVHTLGGGMVWRYSLLFAPIQLEHVKQEMRNLCVLRMIHGFAESMTLLLIQTYIACTSPDSVQEINVISMALSLFNVCWALASFTKNIRQHNVHRLVLTWIGVIFQFMWRLGTLTSRVLVLVLYSTVYTYWVFLVVILHWITMMLWVLSRYAAFKAERLTRLQKIGLSVFVSYIHIFCYVNLEEQSTKLKIVTFYSIMLVENILLIALWTLGEQFTNGMAGWDRNKIFIAVFSSFFLGLFFMLIYYRYFHVRKLAAALNYNPEAVEKPRKPQSPSYSSSDDPAVTVFNCALNPALRKKKKMPSRSVPFPPPGENSHPSTVPFWKEPLPVEERTAGDGLSYSRTTSVDDIRQKLQEKKEKQMQELRRIEDDIAAGRIERPNMALGVSQPIPDSKRQPMVSMGDNEQWNNGHFYNEQGRGQYDLGLGYTAGHHGYGVEEWNREQQFYDAERRAQGYPDARDQGYPDMRDQGYHDMRDQRYPDMGDERHQDMRNQGYPAQPGQRDMRYPGVGGRGRNPEHEYNYNSELDTSGRYRSYKDSSGDQGDVDSGDDLQEHPVPPPHPRQHHRYPALPVPRTRERVVIGGYSHETPL
eukprot:TRINITY_DN67574_c0_g1_i1.p1 TRINITY_DN67574_c0_g1~~TRINITY_DN67574_c0_g1_i1.p1  ORF type:complete len:674 (-),score=96.41 TRINITY_DN67574_c0_g1_i1:90-2111(-)